MIKSIYNEFSANIECLVLKSITEQLPQRKLDIRKLDIPRNVRLADPDFNEPENIDLLIGAGLYWKLMLGTPKNHIAGQPALQNTKLGWIIGGEMYDMCNNSSEVCLTVTDDMLSKQIEKFWIQESVPEKPHHTDEEKASEEYFADTFTRFQRFHWKIYNSFR